MTSWNRRWWAHLALVFLVGVLLVYFRDSIFLFKDSLVDRTAKQQDSKLHRFDDNVTNDGGEVTDESLLQPGGDNDDATSSVEFLAVVTFSTTTSNMRNFHERIFKSLDTWMTDPTYYVVLIEDQKPEYERFCLDNDNETIAEYCSRLHPLFVDCVDGHGNGSTNCKEQQGLLKLWTEIGRFDYVWYCDDDIYLRLDYLKEYLKAFPSRDAFTITAGGPGRMGYGEKSNCTADDISFAYPWGTPVIYSQAAMDILVKTFQYDSLVTIGREFGIMHDVANAILHWMLSLPNNHALQWRQIFLPNSFSGLEMGIHGTGRGGDAKAVYATAENSHATYGNLSIPEPKDFPIAWHNVTGFHQTHFYKNHGDPRNWTAHEWQQLTVDVCVKEAVRRLKRERHGIIARMRST